MEGGMAAELPHLAHDLIAGASLAIEFLGAAFITAAVVKLAVSPGTFRVLFTHGSNGRNRTDKHEFGAGLLMGMDFLVAGDVIKSVALELTLPAISALALLVLIRTFLSWSILVEIEGRWPWTPDRRDGARTPES